MDEVYANLTDKMSEGKSSPYEALQYLQSFVARKKKSIGKESTGLAVFFGADLLAKRKAFNYVGELLDWFISSDQFDIGSSLPRIEDLLKKFTPEDAEPVAQCIYGPLHQKVVKGMTRDNQKDLQARLLKLDAIFADVFQKTEKWSNAYKTVLRLGDIERASLILNDWSKDAFKHEKPLFFARAVLTLLSERKIEQAAVMVKCGAGYLKNCENIDPPRPGDEDSFQLAAWHLCYILSGLASLPPMERVDKTRLFNVLTTMYSDVLDNLDIKLLELLEKVGKQCFAVRAQGENSANPMALFQGLMAANAPQRSQGRGSRPVTQQKKQETSISDIMMQLQKMEAMKKAQK